MRNEEHERSSYKCWDANKAVTLHLAAFWCLRRQGK